MQNKKLHPKTLFSSVCHKHHFANPNTFEIVISLLFLGIIYRVLSILGRDAKY
jgi:hypothetical protein